MCIIIHNLQLGVLRMSWRSFARRKHFQISCPKIQGNEFQFAGLPQTRSDVSWMLIAVDSCNRDAWWCLRCATIVMIDDARGQSGDNLGTIRGHKEIKFQIWELLILCIQTVRFACVLYLQTSILSFPPKLLGDILGTKCKQWGTNENETRNLASTCWLLSRK